MLRLVLLLAAVLPIAVYAAHNRSEIDSVRRALAVTTAELLASGFFDCVNATDRANGSSIVTVTPYGLYVPSENPPGIVEWTWMDDCDRRMSSGMPASTYLSFSNTPEVMNGRRLGDGDTDMIVLPRSLPPGWEPGMDFVPPVTTSSGLGIALNGRSVQTHRQSRGDIRS